MKNWMFLGIAIVSEVVATSALKSSDGFSKLLPSILVIIGYASAFYFLSLTLQTISVGIAYALWSGIGIVLIALVGIFLFDQRLDSGAVAGMSLIVAGVVVMNLFSDSLSH
ncbi:MAG: DMT family transporter [Rhodospirillaceae bacterium]